MERPIIFSGAMVRAILEGRKTQTRRTAKPQPSAGVRDSVFVRSGLEDGHGRELRCPYGQPGQRLWVRENVWIPRTTTAIDRREGADTWPKCIYSADTDCAEIDWMREMRWKQRPSIHMPRWASRITLEITDVRVERVQDISEADARAEGVLWVPGHGEIEPADLEEGYSNYLNCREGFQVLWDSINAKKYPWSANPWVWALAFKRVEQSQ